MFNINEQDELIIHLQMVSCSYYAAYYKLYGVNLAIAE